jgi:hypothetical protein
MKRANGVSNNSETSWNACWGETFHCSQSRARASTPTIPSPSPSFLRHTPILPRLRPYHPAPFAGHPTPSAIPPRPPIPALSRYGATRGPAAMDPPPAEDSRRRTPGRGGNACSRLGLKRTSVTAASPPPGSSAASPLVPPLPPISAPTKLDRYVTRM